VSLNGLQVVGNKVGGGGLHAVNGPNIVSISSDTLQLSGAWLQFLNMSNLATLSFPNLSWIGLSLQLQSLPLLERFQLASVVAVVGLQPNVLFTAPGGVINETGLSEIEGLFDGTPGDIVILNNANLKRVVLLSSQIRLQYNTSYTGVLQVVNNSASVRVDLPNLLSVAGDFILGNCSELSIPQLGLVNGSLEIINTSLLSFSAPLLIRINGNLDISGTLSR
jgi:hypothetical protein